MTYGLRHQKSSSTYIVTNLGKKEGEIIVRTQEKGN